MGENDKQKPVTPEATPAKDERKRKVNDKLRKKLEKLKKDDPNIYPVF